jgi:hypothetical protein
MKAEFCIGAHDPAFCGIAFPKNPADLELSRAALEKISESAS